METKAGRTARDVVTTRIAQQANRWPELALTDMDTSALDERDARLAHAIDQAVARRWLTLAALIDRCLSRSWETLEPQVQAALLVGAAQMLLMERVPDHATIHEAVEWMKRNARKGAAGLVNAVLRKVAVMRGEAAVQAQPMEWSGFESLPRGAVILGDGRVRLLHEDSFAEDPIERAAQQCSCPKELLERWVGAFGAEEALRIALHGLVSAPILVTGGGNQTLTPALSPPPVVRGGGRICDLGEREEGTLTDRITTRSVVPPQVSPGERGKSTLTPALSLGERGGNAMQPGGLTPHRESGFFVFEGGRTELEEFLRAHPGARVQDPGSAAPIAATAPLKPGLIVDYCAGRGTKTRQLAALHPGAKIMATDVDVTRRAALREAVVTCPNVEVIEPRELTRLAGMADLLVLDVPCSNTGVLARRVEAKYRFSRQTLADLVNVQRQIVADSLAMLAKDGQLLYCTCSMEAAENHQQAEWIGRWHRMKTVATDLRRPRGLPGEPATSCSDGSFFALMRR